MRQRRVFVILLALAIASAAFVTLGLLVVAIFADLHWYWRVLLVLGAIASAYAAWKLLRAKDRPPPDPPGRPPSATQGAMAAVAHSIGARF
ncbi:MAG: hypothetical protein R3B49_09435 [Phycisphaerales bacterium]